MRMPAPASRNGEIGSSAGSRRCLKSTLPVFMSAFPG